MKTELYVNGVGICKIDTDNKNEPISFDKRYKGLQELQFKKEGNKINCYLNNSTHIQGPIRLVCVLDTGNTKRPVEFTVLFPGFNNYNIDDSRKKTEVVENGISK